MKKHTLYIILLIATVSTRFNLRAQGINFERLQTWQQVKQKAIEQHKSIFVDCYATWCASCKQMDATVYTDSKVGGYMNDKFISIKMQVDKTEGDDSTVRQWYETAKRFTNVYAVNALPTFLYFSSDGKPLHKHVGAGDANDFIHWAEQAQKPAEQYYAILKHYQPGKLDTAELKGLSLELLPTDSQLSGLLLIEYLQKKGWGQIIKEHDEKLIDHFISNRTVNIWLRPKINSLSVKDLSVETYRDLLANFAKDSVIHKKALSIISGLSSKQISNADFLPLLSKYYKDEAVQRKIGSYLNALSDEELNKKNNILLAIAYYPIIQPGNRLFNFFYFNSQEIDELVDRPRISLQILNFSLSRALITPSLHRADSLHIEPQWYRLSSDVKQALENIQLANSHNKPFNGLADYVMLSSRVKFYALQTAKSEKAASPEKWDWGAKYAAAFALQTRRYSFDSTNYITTILFGNQLEFSVYRYSEDTTDLKDALHWFEIVMRINPGIAYSSDYAGLLYKLKNKDAAIRWQKLTVQLVEDDCYRRKEDPAHNSLYQRQSAILHGMENGDDFKNLIYWAD